MALAVTHIILTIVFLDFFRHYISGTKKFPRYLLVVGGIAGLAPDIDLPLSWIYNLLTNANINFHGTFTHSLIFPVISLGIALILHHKKQMKWAKIFYVISAGLTLHSILDCTFGGYRTFLWPFWITPSFCPQWGINSYASSIDAIILIAWLLHEELHKKIKDYF